jgi:thiosulfate/3-mercaptopyruvate sulfurtransferase
MEEVCTACHGSRVGNEYLGKNEKCKPDVHYTKGMMKCSKCHTGEQMHGDGKIYNHRYEVEKGPKCLSCHEDIYTEKGQNIDQHQTHRESVSCYVCHAQAYTSCYSCHVAKTKEGQPYFKTESHALGFKIGLNPRQSKRHPEKYVTVRHVPIDQDSFKFYVENGLEKFDTQPTWKMATPHSIQRKTTQNSSCNNCHGNPDLFLLKTSVRSLYLNANQSVIVPLDQVPKKVKH